MQAEADEVAISGKYSGGLLVVRVLRFRSKHPTLGTSLEISTLEGVVSDSVWAVHGVIDSEPCLMFFPTRGAALEYVKDVRNCGACEKLAVMEVSGIDYNAVSVGAVFVLGWVQELIQA